MKHYQVRFQPDNKMVVIHHGATLLEAAGLVGIILSNPCGGAGRCGKCKVRLLPSQKEVLACQYTVEHDLEVFVPDTSRFFKQKILEHGIDQHIIDDLAVEKIFIRETVTNLKDLSRVITGNFRLPHRIDKALQNNEIRQQLTACRNGLTAILVSGIDETDADSETGHWWLVGFEEGDTTEKIYGIAVDIGTTTVVARLVNLQTLDVVATVSAGNPQDRYGADVISRIGFAETDDRLKTLHETIVSCLNALFDEAAQKAGIQPKHIYEAVIAGNTTMNHLLLKHPIRQLGQAPYKAHSLRPTSQRSGELGLHINRCGRIYTPPNIAGFVGSDTVAAALACGLDTVDILTLLVDIGTNGEIVLGAKDHLYAASCAAGPALEGTGLTCGSRAQAGAIERIIIDQNDIDIDVIGQNKPTSICGSGLIDAVAVLLDTGIIDATGRFNEPQELTAPVTPEKIAQRVTTYKKEPAFVLAGAENPENRVLLTQKDIRQIQLAKAAIQAGILLLLKEAGYETTHIQQVLLAGAFGNYIQKDNAVRIGMLPDIPVEKIHFVGNAAGSGAHMMLVNRMTRKIAEQLARKIEYLEIAHREEFQTVFTDCLLFPEK